MKKFVVLSALAVAAAAGTTFGQGGIVDNSVQLQLRLVNVTGTVAAPGYTRGQVGGQVEGGVQIFEVQYTLTDGNGTTFPAGLVAGVLNITSNAGGTFAPAALTKLMAQTGGTAPVTATDASGAPTGGFAGATGMERPFRGGFASAGNNADPSNGTAAAGGITNIVPLTISQTLSNPIGGWYGIYLFSVTTSSTITITADFQADPGTGSKFGFFDDSVATPDTSNNTQAGSVIVHVVPAPASAALLGLGGLVAARRRRTA